MIIPEQSDGPKESGRDRLKKVVLSELELQAIGGIDYEQLPATFQLSDATLEASRRVWEAFKDIQPGPSEQRSIDLLTSRLTGNPSLDRETIITLNTVKARIYTAEFGIQFYDIDNMIFEGAVYGGVRGQVEIKQDQDGMDSASVCVNIHNHISERPFSPGDIAIALDATLERNKTVLYIVVNSDQLYLLFTTNQSKKFNKVEFEKYIIKFVDEFFITHTQKMSGLTESQQWVAVIKELSALHKIAFYAGPKNGELIKV